MNYVFQHGENFIGFNETTCWWLNIGLWFEFMFFFFSDMCKYKNPKKIEQYFQDDIPEFSIFRHRCLGGHISIYIYIYIDIYI